MSEKIQRITVKAIIYRNDSVLLVQDHKGRWEMPGGKMDFNESPEDAIRRELQEELGFINVVVGDIINVWTFSVDAEGNEYQFTVIVYEITANDDEVKKSDEHICYEWVPTEKIDALNMRDGYKQAVRKFLEKKAL